MYIYIISHPLCFYHYWIVHSKVSDGTLIKSLPSEGVCKVQHILQKIVCWVASLYGGEGLRPLPYDVMEEEFDMHLLLSTIKNGSAKLCLLGDKYTMRCGDFTAIDCRLVHRPVDIRQLEGDFDNRAGLQRHWLVQG